MKTVIEMAREAGIIHPEMVDKTLERFAELIRADAIADERKACAKLLENICQDYDWAHRQLGLELADEILKRKDK